VCVDITNISCKQETNHSILTNIPMKPIHQAATSSKYGATQHKASKHTYCFSSGDQVMTCVHSRASHDRFKYSLSCSVKIAMPKYANYLVRCVNRDHCSH